MCFATVDVFVKKYVKVYLENLYGNPVNLSYAGSTRDFFLECLNSKLNTLDKKYAKEGINYKPFNNVVKIEISEDDFYGIGFEMTISNMVKFNRFIETNLKKECRIYAALFKSFGMSYIKGVKVFMKNNHLTEDDFSIDTIMKDLQRNGIKIEDSFEDKIIEIISTISKKKLELLSS